MLKKISMTVFCMLLPFIFVWVIYGVTAGIVRPEVVFKAGAFWTFSCIYWFLFLCIGLATIWD